MLETLHVPPRVMLKELRKLMNPKSTSYNSYIRLLTFNLTLKMLKALILQK